MVVVIAIVFHLPVGGDSNREAAVVGVSTNHLQFASALPGIVIVIIQSNTLIAITHPIILIASAPPGADIASAVKS